MGASRSTLQWSLYPNALGYRFPYVVAVLRSTVEVSSLVDQQPQQTLDIPGADEPMALCEGQGRTLYILTRHSILGLTMQTFDNQIDSLVKLRRIAKAADMIELYGSSENTRKVTQCYWLKAKKNLKRTMRPKIPDTDGHLHLWQGRFLADQGRCV